MLKGAFIDPVRRKVFVFFNNTGHGSELLGDAFEFVVADDWWPQYPDLSGASIAHASTHTKTETKALTGGK